MIKTLFLIGALAFGVKSAAGKWMETMLSQGGALTVSGATTNAHVAGISQR